MYMSRKNWGWASLCPPLTTGSFSSIKILDTKAYLGNRGVRQGTPVCVKSGGFYEKREVQCCRRWSHGRRGK